MKAKRFVAYFDMLGMKSAVLRGVDEAWGALCDMRSAMDRDLGMTWQPQRGDIATRVRKRILSDTIVLFTLGEEDVDLWAIVVLSSQLFADNLHRRVPLRGAIAHGEFYFNLDLDLILGVPLVLACEEAEQSQWLGITVDDVVAKRASALQIASGQYPGIVRWDVPLKDGSCKTRNVVNWPVVFRNNFTKDPPIQVKDFYQPFESLFGGFDALNDADKAKYKNTVSFINAQLQNMKVKA